MLWNILRLIKTIEYLQYEGCFGFHRAATAKQNRLCESVLSLERRMFKAEWNAVSKLSWVGYGRAHSLLSLAFADRWNPKHPSYCKYSVV